MTLHPSALLRSGRNKEAGKTTAQPAAAQASAGQQAARPPVQVELTRRLVDPSEPIAKVNGEVITRQQLADECVRYRGEKLFDLLAYLKTLK